MAKDEVASLLSNEWTWHFNLSFSNSTKSESASLPKRLDVMHPSLLCILCVVFVVNVQSITLIGMMRNAQNIPDETQLTLLLSGNFYKFYVHKSALDTHHDDGLYRSKKRECKWHHEKTWKKLSSRAGKSGVVFKPSSGFEHSPTLHPWQMLEITKV